MMTPAQEEVARRATKIVRGRFLEEWEPEDYVIVAFFTSNHAYFPSPPGKPPRKTACDHLRDCVAGELFTALGEELTFSAVSGLLVEMGLLAGERLLHVGCGFGRVLWAARFLCGEQLGGLYGVETHYWRYRKCVEFRQTFSGRCWLHARLGDAVDLDCLDSLARSESMDKSLLPDADVILASDARATSLQVKRMDWLLSQSPFRLFISYRPPGTYKFVDWTRVVPRYAAQHDDGVERWIYFYRPCVVVREGR
jgi:hypothetical protein